ncbi:DUF5776 domain-containing protein [Levilactobacillus yonginensis]
MTRFVLENGHYVTANRKLVMAVTKKTNLGKISDSSFYI